MPKIFDNVTQLIGKTPLIRIDRFSTLHQGQANLIVKLEALNPAGSVKDRIALKMINSALSLGLLASDGVVIEPTSGNTGIGLASVCASKGLKLILTMPENMSIERRKILKAYGAQVILTPADQGMRGAIEKATQLVNANPKAYMPSQFDNPNNPRVHFETTGPEIFHDTDGQVDLVVIGVGTGGSITGIGEYLKGKNPSVKIVAVQPEESPLLTGGSAHPHQLQGLMPNFIPTILNPKFIDEVISVSTQQAYEAARSLATSEGILAGISAGAALHAGMILSQRSENQGKNIVVLLPDGGERYLSTLLYEE
jgi:cysteine synthase A